MVPFRRPSMTDSMASIGHSDISFLETGILWSRTKNLYRHICRCNFEHHSTVASRLKLQELNMRPILDIVSNHFRRALDRHGVCSFCLHLIQSSAGSTPDEDSPCDPALRSATRRGYAVLVCGEPFCC